ILQKAAKKAEEDALVTIGIKPRYPETGYGYIEFEKDEEADAFKVKQFREKPDKKMAQGFVESGRFLWNSGMFIWQTSTIIDAFKSYLPTIYQQVEMLQNKTGRDKQQEAINNFYENCPSISVDYGIMEKAGNVYVIPGRFGWNDVGGWK